MSSWLPGAVAMVMAAFLTGVYGPKLRERAKHNENERNERNAATSTLATVTEHRVETLLARYNSDIEDLRARLRAAEQDVASMRAELSEYKAGIRYAVGFVLVPEPIMQTIRERAPDLLPPSRFPGERVVEAGPGDTGGTGG